MLYCFYGEVALKKKSKLSVRRWLLQASMVERIKQTM